MPQMFARSVRDHGDSPLVDFMGRKFSYDYLGGRAMQVAAGLLKLGLNGIYGDHVDRLVDGLARRRPAL